MKLVLSLSENAIGYKKGVIENMKTSIAGIAANSQQMRIGMTVDSVEFENLVDAWDSLRTDVNAFSEDFLGQVESETEDFSTLFEESDYSSSIEEWIACAWEEAIEATRNKLSDAFSEINETFEDCCSDGFLVDDEWIGTVLSLDLDIFTHAENFPEEIRFEAPALV